MYITLGFFFREMSNVQITPVLDDETVLKTKPNDIDQGSLNIDPDLDRFDKVYCEYNIIFIHTFLFLYFFSIKKYIYIYNYLIYKHSIGFRMLK